MKNHVSTLLNSGSRLDSRSGENQDPSQDLNDKKIKIGLDTSLDFLEVLTQVLTRNSRPKSGRDSGLDSLLKT